MATKKPAPKSSSAKAAKTSKPAATTTKPKLNKTIPNKTAKSTASSTASRSNHKNLKTDKGISRLVAYIIGGVAVAALVIIGIVALAGSMNKNGKNNMTVETGTGEKIETQYLGFDDYKFQLKIPKAFHALTEAEIKQKYNNDVPSVVYADQDNSVNIAISITDKDTDNDKIETYLSTTKNLLSMAGSKILDSKVTKQGNHNIGTLQFVTDSPEGKYYNYIAFFSQDGKLASISFNVKDMDREEWLPVADFVINSLDFTKEK